MDFARDGFGRLTAAGAEQAGTNAVGLDFYNHISFPRRVYGYEGRDPDWPVPAYQEWERCHGPGGRCTDNLIRMYKEDVLGETRFDELTARYPERATPSDVERGLLRNEGSRPLDMTI